jgi:hypothetical protein
MPTSGVSDRSISWTTGKVVPDRRKLALRGPSGIIVMLAEDLKKS